MSGYTEKEKVIDLFKKRQSYLGTRVAEFGQELEELPTADVEPVRHGRWLLDSSGAEFCSECGEYPFDDGEYHISGWSSKYCPNCGAKMDKEEEHGF